MNYIALKEAVFVFYAIHSFKWVSQKDLPLKQSPQECKILFKMCLKHWRYLKYLTYLLCKPFLQIQTAKPSDTQTKN